MSVDGASKSESPDLRVGSYRLLQSLGAGGMSSVFRAVHEETGLEVALKVLPRTFAKNPTTVQRFLREVKNAESLEYPGIVAIYDHGIDRGRHYIVMEFVSGGDLHDRIRDQGPMGVAEALTIVRSVADSLRYANSRGLIHRDIKPANILLTNDHQVKVADLGLALDEQAEDERVTREGTTVGTVDYMAPEQARDSRGTSIRSDMYSLGCTLYFLLTGQPPYPGGDIADKLTRHCGAAIPDVSDFRPDLPESLLAFLAKLLAKRPEQRFESYDALIAAIDRIPRTGANISLSSTLIQSPQPLFALMDEDHEATVSRLDRRTPAADPNARQGDSPPLDSELIPLVDLSNADLADLEGDEPSRKAPAPAALPRLISEPLAPFEPDSESHEEIAGALQPIRNPVEPLVAPHGDSVRSFVLTCVLIGLSIVLLVIGGDRLFRQGGKNDEDGLVEVFQNLADEPDTSAIDFEKAVVIPPIQKKIKDPLTVEEQQTAPEVSVWSEPEDAETIAVAEPQFGDGDESKLIPAWALSPAPNGPAAGKLVPLQRMADPRTSEAKSTLKSALEVVGGSVIEIHDNGPFFESDLRFVGDRRCIRAASGFRPMIVIEAARSEPPPGQTACFELGEKELVLEGVDLVIDVSTISRATTALFSLSGGSVTMRQCTVSLVNASNRLFTVVRTGRSGRASRCHLEGSIIRGACTSIIEVGPGSVEASINRSLVFNPTGCVILDAGQVGGPPDREVAFVRGVFATGNSAIVRVASLMGTRPRKLLSVRALGSTFAHFQSLQPSPFCRALSSASPAEVMDWKGDANEFQGWSSWFAVSGREEEMLENLQAARGVWAETDPSSLESRIPWPIPPVAERIVPAQLFDFAPSRLATLQRLPTPSETLFEQTTSVFERLVEPKRKTNVVASSVPDDVRINPHGRDSTTGQAIPPATVPPGARRQDTPAFGSTPGISLASLQRELLFKTDEPGQNGDLGLFLAANIKPGEKWTRVRVEGFGDHPFTPFRVPDEVGLEIVVVPRPGGIVPSWTAATTTSSSALIESRGGALSLVGVKLHREGTSLLRSLIRVERGHLILDHCRLTDSGKSIEPGGAMIEFVASGSKPLPPLTTDFPGPFDPFIDRPVCLVTDSILKGSGRVFSSEVGRGLFAFRQSVLISSETLFDLTLSKVAKNRVLADLVLDHCSLSTERGFVEFGTWRGGRPGPERPLVVSSTACAFLGNFEKGARDSTVLRSDPLGVASGGIFWQSNGDLFDVPNFTSLAGGRGVSPSGVAKRLDIRWDWIELWGQIHAKNNAGPRGGTVPSTPLFAKLKPGDVEPGDLYMNSNGKDTVDFGANLAKLGIMPSPVVGRKR